jgi:hypothetical protein
MNYTKIYTELIQRAKTRTLAGYKESHHIIPRCLGGQDTSDNVVDLTPEEHYTAHLLLIKIYPENNSLIQAASMMTVNAKNHQRKNKLYGWLRRKHAVAMSENQTGSGNSQFGTCWVSHLEKQECKKVDKNLLEEYLTNGWIKKRIIDWNTNFKKRICPLCNKEYISANNTCSLSCGQKLFNKLNPKEFGKGKLESMIKDYRTGSSIYKCLKNAGLNGTGKNHTKLKKILKEM